MRKSIKAALAAALALCMAFAVLPASTLIKAKAETAASWTVPEGYNAHDYNKCVAYLEQTDEDGRKNGEKLNHSYNSNDPETWENYSEDQNGTGEYFDYPRFQWTTIDGEKRIWTINVMYGNQNGIMDVSGCTALETLNCYVNRITELDVSGCLALETLDCYINRITELDVSGCLALESLYCYSNELTELDVSKKYALKKLNCSQNKLTDLDVS